MEIFRNYIVKQLVCVFFALCIFNVSIDPPDLLKNLDQDMALEEDLSINEMESISELVLEDILNINNAVPEKEDTESDGFIKKVDLHLIERLVKFSYSPMPIFEIALQTPLNQPFFSLNNRDTASPPPKV